MCFDTGECYNFGEGEDALDEGELLEDEDNIENEAEELISLGSEIVEGAYEEELHDQGLIDRLTGYILLQVDLHGEAWYVNPDDGLRYYMKNGAIAYEMMRSFGLGITDADLESIPTVETTEEMLEVESICSTNSVANRLKGDILLQVEQHGEAWWVHPETCHRIYMKDGAAAYEIMRYLSTGITSEDLTKMPTGDIK